MTVFDPEAMENARRAYPDLRYADSLARAVSGADVTVLLTEWTEFCDADPEALGALVAERRIVDARHALDASAYRAAGWQYRALGRPSVAATIRLAEHQKDSVGIAS